MMKKIIYLITLIIFLTGCKEIPAPVLTKENHYDADKKGLNVNGWKRADCFACHSREECFEAKETDREPDCVPCHGHNGARDYYHLTDQDCYRSGCHPNTHTGLNFKTPQDCKVCHYYPDETE